MVKRARSSVGLNRGLIENPQGIPEPRRNSFDKSMDQGEENEMLKKML